MTHGSSLTSEAGFLRGDIAAIFCRYRTELKTHIRDNVDGRTVASEIPGPRNGGASVFDFRRRDEAFAARPTWYVDKGRRHINFGKLVIIMVGFASAPVGSCMR